MDYLIILVAQAIWNRLKDNREKKCDTFDTYIISHSLMDQGSEASKLQIKC